MKPPPRPSSDIRFGPFDLNVRAGELRKEGLRIRLQDQPFQILRMLLERPGETVLREEIRDKLWPDGTVVEFDHSINAAVKRLRDALSDSAENPRYIETLARRGYRFIGEVDASESEPPPVAAGSLQSTVPLPALPNVPPKPHWRLPAGFLLATVLALIAVAWKYQQGAPARQAREVELPGIIRLVDAGKNAPAFSHILHAERVIPGDATLNRLRREISHPISIHTNPPGATIWAKPYEEPAGEWLLIGQSPLENFLLPLGYFRWKIEKPGFRTVEGGAGFQTTTLEFTLDPLGTIPSDMVHVAGGTFQLLSLNPVHLDDFWMDTYEVTNKQFKTFIEKGGYTNQQYWREKFIKNGQTLSWPEAMAGFRDSTGRPGPSTWDVGDYPAGHDDYPVAGVSWYEAAAYAEFATKQLPTVYHWYRAANQGIYSEIVLFSNYATTGPLRVGSRGGLGPFGTYDMAGNVREWCANATGNHRYILGGGWNDQRYSYTVPEAAPPFDRSPANGFRCVKQLGSFVSPALAEPIEKPVRDYRTEKPASDEVFHILSNFYSYDHTELKAVRQSVDATSTLWNVEHITLDAAYGPQRIIASLYLPKNAKPPYQTVVYFPSRSALYLGAVDDYEVKLIEFLVKSGHAVLFPVYQGMYQRRPTSPPGPSGERDRVIEQSKDLRRCLDYLETRSDIALDRIGYYGISDGARLGLILLAEEPRIRVAVLSAGGLSREHKPMEIDEINFAPRVRIPVLMLNGRYDLFSPAETDQLAMFRLLGSPLKDKRHVLFDSGHLPLHRQEIKEKLDWFDRYLGPVNR